MPTRPVVLYNVQRLFRPGGSAIARALDATEEHGWTRAVYRRKVRAVGAVLADATAGARPAVLVLVEVEDATVVGDVCAAAGWPELVDVAVPGESTDGYDVAIAYDPAVFDGHTDTSSFTFVNRFATRDLLVATLRRTGGRPLTVLASHWASRSMSDAEVLRIGGAMFCTNVLERVLKYGKDELFTASGLPRLPAREELAARWSTPVLFAGDVNDNPWDRSVRALLGSTPDAALATRPPRLPRGRSRSSVAAYLRLRPRLYNPTWDLIAGRGGGPRGTYRYSGDWYALDQVLVSAGMLDGGGPGFVHGSLRVHGPRTVDGPDGPVAVTAGDGTPLPFDAKTGVGVSDHLPLVASVDL